MAKAKDWGNWEEVDRSENYSMITSNEGPGGSGKSHFVCTGPEPICFHMFDPDGLAGLKKNPLFKKKEIRVISYNFNPGKLSEDDRPKAAQDALEQFKENQDTALTNARTIAWDKEDHVWEMVRYANLESFTGKPSNYYELNLLYRGFFHDAAMAGVNLSVIRGLKKVWGRTGVSKEGKTQYGYTDEVEARGQGEIPELVQVVLRHRWDKDVQDFVAQIHEKCRVGNAKKLIGREFQALTFRDLGEAIYPETRDMDDSPWE